MKAYVMLIRSIFIVPLLFIASEAFSQTELLLKLKFTSDDQVTKTISFYGDNIDPNISFQDEQFKIAIDGTDIDDIDIATFYRLKNLRRNLSYDFQTGGIEKLDNSSGVKCRLGGPASAIVLEVRYLTYDNSTIVSDEMRTVYDLPLNCLYSAQFKPKSSDAKASARGVIETLRTIDELK
ncbi:hypothetical protein [Endozoicomonas sp. SCSIO W0465]|uniref:hypothetical protein n=1 Tax=Endozoicomonas sp. SCSIO W0465 TaxID=2918516 RepID=UPI0020763440|nr:hypothetical protein [Endozoicomonas sp. SCSIO W0465]USE35830.1 hypothetical protein MJO57_27825 [Endozoicomonas sp. SCSIO W0465]